MKAETETVMTMMMAAEVEAEATNKLMSICLEGSEEEPVEKHMDHLVSTIDDTVKAISELLEILSVQPLAENEMMVADKAEAEATSELMSTSLDDSEEEPLEKHLNHLVSTK
ncbi:hypothetical protein AOLI_G00179880 [Acnodon oligacanthus]